MASNYVEWYIQLVDKRLDTPIDDDAGLYNVLTASDPAELTIYSNDSGGTQANPGTMSNGIIQFWTASTVTSLDISILTSTGRAYFLEGVTQSQHRIQVDTERAEYQLILPYNMILTADGAVIPTGFQLINGMRVKDVFVHKTAVLEGIGAALLFDVGVSGDPDGFIDGITGSATGYYLNEGLVITADDTETISMSVVREVQTRGTLLMVKGGGTSATATTGAGGFFFRKNYLASLATTTNNIVYAVNGTSASATGKGYIYIEYDLLKTAGN